MEIFDFFLVGLIAGILADRERKQKQSLQRTTTQLHLVGADDRGDHVADPFDAHAAREPVRVGDRASG